MVQEVAGSTALEMDNLVIWSHPKRSTEKVFTETTENYKTNALQPELTVITSKYLIIQILFEVVIPLPNPGAWWARIIGTKWSYTPDN